MYFIKRSDTSDTIVINFLSKPLSYLETITKIQKRSFYTIAKWHEKIKRSFHMSLETHKAYEW